MEKLMCSVAASVCLLALLSGGAFADNLHSVVTNPPPNTVVTPNGTGQTGSNVLSNCSGTPGMTTSFGTGMTPGSSGSNNGSPFSSTGQAGAVYAGNPGTASAQHSGSPNTAVAQYDNACGQAAARQLH
jgi:hypothetical protein